MKEGLMKQANQHVDITQNMRKIMVNMDAEGIQSSMSWWYDVHLNDTKYSIWRMIMIRGYQFGGTYCHLCSPL